ncbi:FHIPEP family type III secretion protein, partial [Elioraea sp.]|uniref:FHIPEP family type III secretion protein n=1 Tax=Elioraea sp. TaxID=2185103 RepID=UPI0038D0F21D
MSRSRCSRRAPGSPGPSRVGLRSCRANVVRPRGSPPAWYISGVLQNLLDEGVPIRDMRTIVETLADAAQRT